ncbi:recombinase family protein [Streptomyces sp. NPDC001339]|uniref:recombinase family protein n=1 Tax=Streptomyces sp. NPDC001339 TaxID=3364563 RepID=UPI0036C6B571
MTAFAFAGRCSTEDLQDPEASRDWQLTRARTLVEPAGGRIVAEYFDVGHSRSLPWKRRPRASQLLDALKDPDRGFEAVVVGEPQRVFYDNQFSLTFPLFVHYGVELWVPEVGGRVDPNSEAHDMVMSVFGGMSKGERNRIKIRVRAAMSSQAQLEGRFLGGRPPYGYRIVDAGPHPNPAKAADGKRLHRLEIDLVAAPIVQRIFREYVEGRGFYAIAEGLTADGIPCPSAHDPARNRHREGLAWTKGAVRAILVNPRYTGHQVWNKQRKQEILLDVEDVALGYETRMRWNGSDAWMWSKEIVHPPVIDRADFHRVQEVMAARGTSRRVTKERRGRCHDYQLQGLVDCGLCQRIMGTQWSHETAYYRCRFPLEYALANKIAHPRNILFREQDVVPRLDQWISLQFAPGHKTATIERMHQAQLMRAQRADLSAEANAVVRDCNVKLARYRSLIDSGAASSETVAQWIAETETRRASAAAQMRTRKPTLLTRTRITELVDAAGSTADVLQTAPGDKKNRLYRALGVRMTYQPAKRIMRVGIAPDPHDVGQWKVSEVRVVPGAYGSRRSPPNWSWFQRSHRSESLEGASGKRCPLGTMCLTGISPGRMGPRPRLLTSASTPACFAAAPQTLR